MAQQRAKHQTKEVSLRTIVWTDAVLRVSGKSLASLEEEFRQAKKKGVLTRSCIWQKYKNGTVVPRNAEKGRHGLVERVDARYSGTAEWFYLPLWRLCSDQSVSMAQIKDVYCGLGSELKALFVLDKQAVFWRKRFQEFDDTYLCDELRFVGSPDGLIALMALLREAETTQNRELYQDASWALVDRLKNTKTDASWLSEAARDVLAQRVITWRRASGLPEAKAM